MTDPAPRISEDELDLDPTQALGVALSVQAGSMLMEEAQDRAPAMLAHLQAMGYDVVPVATARSAPAAGLRPVSEPTRPLSLTYANHPKHDDWWCECGHPYAEQEPVAPADDLGAAWDVAEAGELARLEELAGKATPGPWWHARSINYRSIATLYAPVQLIPGQGAQGEYDAAYIAALSPDIVLRLIAAARSAPAAGLDADHLMMAMRNVERRRERLIRWDRDADEIAREYAALAAALREPKP